MPTRVTPYLGGTGQDNTSKINVHPTLNRVAIGSNKLADANLQVYGNVYANSASFGSITNLSNIFVTNSSQLYPNADFQILKVSANAVANIYSTSANARIDLGVGQGQYSINLSGTVGVPNVSFTAGTGVNNVYLNQNELIIRNNVYVLGNIFSTGTTSTSNSYTANAYNLTKASVDIPMSNGWSFQGANIAHFAYGNKRFDLDNRANVFFYNIIDSAAVGSRFHGSNLHVGYGISVPGIIGIGTTTPGGSSVNVYVISTGSTMMRLTRTSVGDAWAGFSTVASGDGSDWYFDAIPTSATGQGYAWKTHIGTGYGSNTAMVINRYGNVAIGGTLNPMSNLHVNGNLYSASTIATGTNLYTVTGLYSAAGIALGNAVSTDAATQGFVTIGRDLAGAASIQDLIIFDRDGAATGVAGDGTGIRWYYKNASGTSFQNRIGSVVKPGNSGADIVMYPGAPASAPAEVARFTNTGLGLWTMGNAVANLHVVGNTYVTLDTKIGANVSILDSLRIGSLSNPATSEYILTMEKSAAITRGYLRNTNTDPAAGSIFYLYSNSGNLISMYAAPTYFQESVGGSNAIVTRYSDFDTHYIRDNNGARILDITSTRMAANTKIAVTSAVTAANLSVGGNVYVSANINSGSNVFSTTKGKFTKLVGALDVTTYGADPTYTNDSSSAFRSWWNDIKATGLNAYIPPGRYKLSSNLIWDMQDSNTYMGISVIGGSMGNAILDFSTCTTSPNLLICGLGGSQSAPAMCNYSKFEGFTVNGNIDGAVLQLGVNGTGVGLSDALDSYIFENMIVTNSNSGNSNTACGTEINNLVNSRMQNFVSDCGIVTKTLSVTNVVSGTGGVCRYTVSSTGGLVDNMQVTVSGVVGVSAANTTGAVTVVNATTFEIQGTVFSGSYTSGGTVTYYLGHGDAMRVQAAVFSYFSGSFGLANVAIHYNLRTGCSGVPYGNVWDNIDAEIVNAGVFRSIPTGPETFTGGTYAITGTGYVFGSVSGQAGNLTINNPNLGASGNLARLLDPVKSYYVEVNGFYRNGFNVGGASVPGGGTILTPGQLGRMSLAFNGAAEFGFGAHDVSGGNSAQTLFNFMRASNSIASFLTTNNTFIMYSNSSPAIYVDNNQQVGIGGAPAAKFDIQHALNGASYLRHYNSSTGGSASVFFQQNVGGRWVDRTVNYTGQYLAEGGTGSGITLRYSDFDTHLFRVTDGATLLDLSTTRMAVNTKVAIASSLTASNLNVGGNTFISSNIVGGGLITVRTQAVIGRVDEFTPGSSANLVMYSSGGSFMRLMKASTGGDVNLTMASLATGDGSDFYFEGNPSGIPATGMGYGWKTVQGTGYGANTAMIINRFGNVAIGGTLNPMSNLHVNGNSHVTIDMSVTGNAITYGGLIGNNFQATKTANYTLLVGDSRGIFDTLGATSNVYFTLPSVGRGLEYTFIKSGPQALHVIAPASTAIAVGSTISANAGSAYSNTSFSALTLVGVASNLWIAKTSTGTWTVA
jgi:hypothetical protein